MTSLSPLSVVASHLALDGEIASLDPAETLHRPVEPAAWESPPGDSETDMGSLQRLLRTGAGLSPTRNSASGVSSAPGASTTNLDKSSRPTPML